MSSSDSASADRVKLFDRILDVNPETEKLKSICRILLDQPMPCSKELEQLAFTSVGEDVEQQPLPKEVETQRVGDQEIEEMTIGNMTDLREFSHTLKKEFLLPDVIFYQRLAHRELMVHKKQFREKRQSWEELFDQRSANSPQKKLARQKTYILLDVSASTEAHHRLVVEKAIAVAYLEANRKGKGEVFYRPFNQQPGSLRICKTSSELRRLINHDVMTAKPIGQTNLQLVLEIALQDLKEHISETPAEILLLTDGLATLDLPPLIDMAGDHKIHVVLVGGDLPTSTDKTLQERFRSIHAERFRKMEHEADHREREKLQSRLDSLFQHNKQKIQEEYLDELQHHLETLSQKTKGLFIQIPDLPEDWASRASQLETIQDRIRAIETELQDSNTTDLDKQQLVDELLSLRTYIEELSNQSRDAVHQQQCKQLKEEVGRITLSSEELQSMLRNAGVNWTAKTRSNGIQLSLWQTLRLVFRHFFRR